ncbi:phospholipid methyltransferase [Fomitiporia mediterranea MF3/22]|uniref:phospholipid methyltransferase n=1 Tax=Fomitiporia mediterranea (strain MF3/22) TaxID=694068 RepID=UPI00044087E8|nr:phospholipid methyltransferase [Fomitiporia mediterranea MF3/22]EJD05227.1 phospholipid methyltransferase [Fomitiporia mediterranea MF3/22]
MEWIDINKTSLIISLASITFNPLAWNIVARNEYRNKSFTRLFGGNAKIACYFLALLIFSFGILRDSLYHRALAEQPTRPILPNDAPLNLHIVVPAVLFVVGQTLVVTSTWALGITGTFLGDYFGILMDHRVEGFPFNVVENPMYDGSTLCFLATALWYEKPAGLAITLYVYICYRIALMFEGPFTAMIYSKRANGVSKASKKEL